MHCIFLLKAFIYVYRNAEINGSIFTLNDINWHFKCFRSSEGRSAELLFFFSSITFDPAFAELNDAEPDARYIREGVCIIWGFKRLLTESSKADTELLR